MIKSLFFALVFLVGFSCGNTTKKSGLVSGSEGLTRNEDKGIKEILSYYAGFCKSAKGGRISTDGNVSYFELEISKSPVIDDYLNTLELPASDIAYTFYKNLKEERLNYSEIRTNIILKSGQKCEYKFPTTQLQLVDEKMSVVHQVISLIKNKKFDSLKTILNDSSVISYDKSLLIDNMIKAEENLENISGFIPFGFSQATVKEGKSVLHISGIIQRETKNTEFSIDFDLSSTPNDIIFIQYRL